MQKIINGVYKVFSAMLRFCGLQNVIILEMEGGKRENTQAVFEEMLRRGWNKRYRIVLISYCPETVHLQEANNVTLLKRILYGDSRVALRQMRWLYARACMIVDENIQFNKRNPKTIHVYLSHGSPVKSTHDFYNCTEDTDYSLCQSEFWRPIESYQMRIPEEKLIIKGFPRNDELFSSKVSMKQLFGKEHNKVVVWYPTFRQREKRSGIDDTESSALPIIHDEDAARRINEIAAKYHVLLVVKPHPVQDLSRIKTLDLDHLKVITGEFLAERGITDHAFLAKSDAMITDYSSIVFDYLLTGKPIALAQEDYEEYEKKVGFAIDMNLLRSCAVQLETAEDFEPFIRDLVEGNDPLREKRDELMHLTNQYTDGHSTERVVDWLETLLKN